MCLFLAATCTSQCKLRSLRANARLSALIYTFRVSSLNVDCNDVFGTKAYSPPFVSENRFNRVGPTIGPIELVVIIQNNFTLG